MRRQAPVSGALDGPILLPVAPVGCRFQLHESTSFFGLLESFLVGSGRGIPRTGAIQRGRVSPSGTGELKLRN